MKLIDLLRTHSTLPSDVLETLIAQQCEIERLRAELAGSPRFEYVPIVAPVQPAVPRPVERSWEVTCEAVTPPGLLGAMFEGTVGNRVTFRA